MLVSNSSSGAGPAAEGRLPGPAVRAWAAGKSCGVWEQVTRHIRRFPPGFEDQKTKENSFFRKRIGEVFENKEPMAKNEPENEPGHYVEKKGRPKIMPNTKRD
jgi:hypothetical protein